jgi:hypothetical protein
MATLKGENARGADDAMAQYQEHLARTIEQAEERRVQGEAAFPSTTDGEVDIIKYIQTTPYRTKDRNAPD